MAYVSKNLTNPFDKIERIPEDEAEQRALMNAAFEYGLEYIGEQWSKFQKATNKNKNDTALLMTLAWIWVENRQMFKFEREKRLELEERVAALEARPPVPWERLDNNDIQSSELHRRVDGLIDPFADWGIWDQHKSYRIGTCVTDGGSLWRSVKQNKGSRPGGNGDGDLKHNRDWKLIAKRGAPGKDLSEPLEKILRRVEKLEASRWGGPL